MNRTFPSDELPGLYELVDKELLTRAQEIRTVAGVSQLRTLQNNSVLTAVVTDGSESHRIYLAREDGAWSGDCSCMQDFHCPHTLAVLIESLDIPQSQSANDVRSGQHDTRPTSISISKAKPPTAREERSIESDATLIYVIELTLITDTSIAHCCQLNITPRISRTFALNSGDIDFRKFPEFDINSVRRGLFPRFIQVTDKEILTEMLQPEHNIERDASFKQQIPWSVLSRCLQSERCYLYSRTTHDRAADSANRPIASGPAITPELNWHLQNNLSQQLEFSHGDQSLLIASLPQPIYIDTSLNRCGLLLVDPDLIRQGLMMRPVSFAQIDTFNNAESNSHPGMPFPRVIKYRLIDPHQIRGLLTLYLEVGIAVAKVEICYDAWRFDYKVVRDSETPLRYIDADEVTEFRRDKSREEQILKEVSSLQVLNLGNQRNLDNQQEYLGLPDPSDWLRFINQIQSDFSSDDWLVEIDNSFPYRIVHPDQWAISLQPMSVDTKLKPGDWFSLHLGVMIDGLSLNILPSLLALLKSYLESAEIWDDESITQVNGLVWTLDDQLLVPLVDHKGVVPISKIRLRRILETLVELFDQEVIDPEMPVALPEQHLSRLLALGTINESGTNAADPSWHADPDAGKRMRTVLNKGPLRAFVADEFNGSLRSYQQHGVAWIQLLANEKLAGILADDMGLGKTIQALAVLAGSNGQGIGNKPSLIVVPASLLGNWQQEARRFTPHLRWLTYHGAARQQHRTQLSEFDVITTTYQTLAADYRFFKALRFRYLLLDEAQVIRNPLTLIARTVKQIQAEHRLCITGTPMENHLGELWSLYEFLMPGFLGSKREFDKYYRIPIERYGSQSRRAALQARIAPFLLRRTKDMVATELPAKTVVVLRAALSDSQRDLYESIRLSMHRQVQQVLAAKQIGRSRITLLSALMKLRQVCCDPRLLPVDSRANVSESAKLDLLMTLVRELVEENRYILIFSQFTSMLKLIEHELNALRIDYDLLTGQSRNRGQLVERFQSGEFQVFLISLKAGGVGLNLTRADTVIHYDPWWNPAVETQASDRAHRIGQTKPIFVYRLITEGTIEEKIINLQADKQRLIDSIYDNQPQAQQLLSNEELSHLLDPLPN